MSNDLKLLNKQQQLYLKIMEDLHKNWKPHSMQLEIGKKFYGKNIKNLFLQLGRKAGKAHCINELVLTPSGFVKNGDLKKGDVVFDENGKQQLVLEAHPVITNPESYRVHFDNGEFIDACADHKWFTWIKRDRKNFRRSGIQKSSVKTTKEIFESQMDGKECNHSIPIAKPLELKEQSLLIPPYVLGAWLGDGTASSGGIAGLDTEVFDSIRALGYEVIDLKNPCNHSIKGLIGQLKELGVYKNKHIPHQYLMGSIEQRTELLQGLLDTNGYCSDRGNLVEFCNTNKNLADGVYFLAASLGLAPSIRSKQPKCSNEKYKDSICKIAYLVTFHPNGQKLFKIKRKQDRVKEFKKTYHHTIIKVEKIPSIPMRCISVSGESKLYLAGKSLIPTHNSEMAIYMLWRHALLNPGAACYYVAPEFAHGKEIVWRDARLYNMAPKEYVHGVNNNECTIYLKNKSFIKVIGSENFAAANGLRPGFLVYDEFCEFHPRFHETMNPNRLVYKCPLVIIGTPPLQASRNKEQYIQMAQDCRDDKKESMWIQKTSYDNPHNSREELDKEKAKLFARGEEYLWYSQYEAKLTAGGRRVIFPMLSPDRHVRPHSELMEEIRRDAHKLEWYCVVDPGTTTVMAVLFAAINPYTKKMYLLDEIYEKKAEKTSVRQVIPEIERKVEDLKSRQDFGDDWIKVYDEAAAWFANEVSNQYDYFFQPTEKMRNKTENGISLIKDTLVYDVVVISERCKNLVWEMTNYIADDNGKFPSKNNHLIDAHRYLLGAANYSMVEVMEAVRQLGPRKISDIQNAIQSRNLEDEDDWTQVFD